MTIRQRAAGILRSFDAHAICDRGMDVVYDVQGVLLRVANRIDPPAPLLPPLADEADLQWWRDLVAEQNAALGRHFDEIFPHRADGPPSVMWRDPVIPPPSLREDVLAKISESMDKPDLPTLDVPTFAPFEQVDLAPFIAQIDAQVSQIARQYRDAADADLASFLDEVGQAAPGFDSDVARQILHDRENPRPEVEGEGS